MLFFKKNISCFMGIKFGGISSEYIWESHLTLPKMQLLLGENVPFTMITGVKEDKEGEK